MNNKIIKSLIPVVAVIVIFESIMLVSNLENNNASSNKNNSSQISDNAEKNKPSVFELSLLTENKKMKIGDKYEVSLKVKPKEDVSLNALDLYVKFDPEMIDVSNLVSTKDLGEADFIKVSDKKSVTVTNFLFETKEGMTFIKDKEITLITFSVTPKKAGKSYFEISTGDSEGDSVTMFVDKVDSKSLPFSGNKLEVNLVN